MTSVKIITLFPEFFSGPLSAGLLGKAVRSKILEVGLVNLRDYSEGTYNQCDDYPYGGGSGMVLMPGPLFRALEPMRNSGARIILTSPSGRQYNQEMVEELSRIKEICIICGHYEGVDQRVIDRYVHQEISIGDYVLSGGEFAALVILDSLARYIPGFMSNTESLLEETFEGGLLEYPQYTRPAEIEGMKVPEVLLSGNHARIREWRREQRIEKTRKVRPDLYARYLSIKEGEK